jgi:hypothetical protein
MRRALLDSSDVITEMNFNYRLYYFEFCCEIGFDAGGITYL